MVGSPRGVLCFFVFLWVVSSSLGMQIRWVEAAPAARSAPPTAAVIARLTKQLRAKSWRQRVIAIRELSRLKAHAAPALRHLMVAMKDSRPEVRGAAAFAFGAIGAKAAPAIPLLLAALRDPHPWVRGFAAFGLAKMGPKGHKALLNALKQPHLPSRQLAAVVLSRILKPQDKLFASLLVHLRAATTNRLSWVRFYAVQGLRKLGDRSPATLAVLRKTMTDKHRRIRRESLHAISRFGASATALVPTLLAMRKATKGVSARRQILRTLGYIAIRNTTAILALKQDYADKRYSVRWEAWRALKRLGVKLPQPSFKKKARKSTKNTPRRASPVARRPAAKRPASRPTTSPAAKKAPTSRPANVRPKAATTKPSTMPAGAASSRPASRPAARK